MSRIYYFCEMKMLNALSKLWRKMLNPFSFFNAKMLFALSKLWIL